MTRPVISTERDAAKLAGKRAERSRCVAGGISPFRFATVEMTAGRFATVEMTARRSAAVEMTAARSAAVEMTAGRSAAVEMTRPGISTKRDAAKQAGERAERSPCIAGGISPFRFATVEMTAGRSAAVEMTAGRSAAVEMTRPVISTERDAAKLAGERAERSPCVAGGISPFRFATVEMTQHAATVEMTAGRFATVEMTAGRFAAVEMTAARFATVEMTAGEVLSLPLQPDLLHQQHAAAM